MIKVLLIGQPIDKNRIGKVGGGGGYVRNMRVYLKYFQSSEIEIIPCFHTSRKEYGSNVFSNFFRIFIDLTRFLKCLIAIKPDGIHIMAQYRDALPREVMYLLISKLMNMPIMYEIKAGAFIDAYYERSPLYRKMVKIIVINSKVILVEGKKYINFLKDHFGTTSYYFPNIVPDSELPYPKENILSDDVIKILFVGYCNYDKGVFHLVDACKMFAEDGLYIELNFIGEEHNDFSEYLDNLNINQSNFNVNRFGEQSHDFILKKMTECDVFCYPSFHSGEGHSNSVNEAMMNSMIIISTKNGFLRDILDWDSAYFVNEKSKSDIYNALIEVNNNRVIARNKAINAYNTLKNNYLVSNVIDQMNEFYHELVDYNA
jgi:glycosyltransferase involved in cell wall biosynthesis